MKNIFIISGAIVIFSIVHIGCGQDSNKQKELELKEKELALKEKELALKEKGISTTRPTEAPNNSTPNSKAKNNEETPNSNGEKFLGLWKYDNNGFIKITKDNSGKFKFQDGRNYENNNESSISWQTDEDVYAKFLNGKLEGKYRIWEGSAFDAYSDINFNLQLKTDNKLFFKTKIKTGGGANYNESYVATKIK